MKQRTLFWVVAGIFFVSGVVALPVWGSSAFQATPTSTATVFAEALNPDANVRAEPSIEGTRLGVIQPGARYGVQGKRFEWLLIEYAAAPNGWAWVHQSVVTVSGDVSLLPEVDPANLPPLVAGVASSPTATGATMPSAATSSQTPLATSPVSPPIPTLRLPTFTPPAATPTPLDFSMLEAGTLTDQTAELERRMAILETVYVEQPIVLRYAGNIIVLSPSEIGFQIDAEAMRTALQAGLNAELRIAEVAINASYSSEQLNAYIQDIARRYDTPARPSFDNAQLVFNAGTTGVSLDVEAARGLIETALFSPASVSRTLDLPLLANTNHRLDMTPLRQAILNFLATRGIPLNSADSVISVYVRDLAMGIPMGIPMGIQENVLHSGVSTSKIGLMASYFRTVYQEPAPDMKFHLIAAALCSSNVDANALIDAVGNNNTLDGLVRTTDTYCQAGAANTEVNRHFWIGPPGENGIPANYYVTAESAVCPIPEAVPVDGSVTADIDPYLPTTALDMGQMLGMIYTCAADEGGLAEVFPGEVTQSECEMMLEILRGTRFMHMAELGIPEGVPFAHKVGYGGEAIGDAGIVFSPGGDYVLVIYMWDARLAELDTYALSRWNVLAEVSRIVYNYFNIDAPMRGQRLPPNPFGGVACVLPNNPSAIDLTNIDNGRFDVDGNPVPSACYDWPNCRPFTGWGQ